MSSMLDDVLGLPDQLRDAIWRVETARLEPAESAGLMVCGMGGSAIGGDLAAAALGDRLTEPLISSAATGCRAGRRRSGPCSAPATRATPRRRSPASRRPRRSARGGSSPAPAAPWSTGRGGRGAGRRRCRGSSSPAPRSPTCSPSPPRSPALAGIGPPHPHRDRRRRGVPRARGRDAAAAGGEIAAELDGARAGHLRRRPDRAGRPPLEDAGQREREAARLLRRAAGGRPQRALRLAGDGAARLAASSSRTATSTRGSPALRAHRRVGRRRGHRGAGRDRGGDPGRAAALGGDAGRSGDAGAGRASAASTRSRWRRSSASRRGWDESDGPRGRAGTRLRPITFDEPKPMVPC